MKRNQEGFTLIELLAVIVILAIIALIATPIVLNIINNVRKSAAEDSLYGTMQAIELAYTEKMLTGSYTLPVTVTFVNSIGEIRDVNMDVAASGDLLKMDGTTPKTGTIQLEKTGHFNSLSNLSMNGFDCTIINNMAECH